MKSKLRILLMTALCLVCLFAFTACGSGVEIGANGNWFVDGKDTGVSAAGEDGSRVEIGPNGHWYIDARPGIPCRGDARILAIHEPIAVFSDLYAAAARRKGEQADQAEHHHQ